jgi:catechol 2,3-dioxygenase-like lactoylglutathione lyase family enzyme
LRTHEEEMPMELHRGRLIDHVHLEVTELSRSRRFYQAVLAALAIEIGGEGEGYFFCDELWVSSSGGTPSRVHLAFQAADRDMVQRFHEAGLQSGGRDNGAPGERGYHPGYYAAYLLDPDNNNLEAVYHGPAQRSAPSVVIRPAPPK